MPDYFFSLLRTFLQGGTPLIISFVLGNILSTHDYGMYVSFLLFSSTVAVLLTVPTCDAAIHYIIKTSCKKEQDNIYYDSLFLSILNALIIGFLMLFFKGYLISLFNLNEISREGYLLLISITILTVLYAFFSKLMTVRFLFRYQVSVLILSTFLQAGTIGYCIYYESDPIWFVSSFLVFYLSGIVFYKRRLAREFIYSYSSLFDANALIIFRFGALVYFGAMAGFLDEKIDLISINYFLSKSELAWYSYAIAIGTILYGVGLGISQVIFPKFCDCFAKKKTKELRVLYRRSINVIYFLLSIIVLLILFHSELIISYILPVSYLKMIPSLTIILPGIVLFGTMASVGTLLTAKGQPEYALILLSIFLILNAALNILLIPEFGILGAAIATSVSFFLRAIAALYINNMVVGTHYKIHTLLLSYLLLVMVIILGINVSQFLREIIILLYSYVIYKLIFDKKERELVIAYFWTLRV